MTNPKIFKAAKLLNLSKNAEKILLIFEENSYKCISCLLENGNSFEDFSCISKEISSSKFSKFLEDFIGIQTRTGSSHNQLFDVTNNTEIDYLFLSIPDGFFTISYKTGETNTLNVSENIETILRKELRFEKKIKKSL